MSGNAEYIALFSQAFEADDTQSMVALLTSATEAQKSALLLYYATEKGFTFQIAYELTQPKGVGFAHTLNSAIERTSLDAWIGVTATKALTNSDPGERAYFCVMQFKHGVHVRCDLFAGDCVPYVYMLWSLNAIYTLFTLARLTSLATLAEYAWWTTPKHCGYDDCKQTHKSLKGLWSVLYRLAKATWRAAYAMHIGATANAEDAALMAQWFKGPAARIAQMEAPLALIPAKVVTALLEPLADWLLLPFKRSRGVSLNEYGLPTQVPQAKLYCVPWSSFNLRVALSCVLHKRNHNDKENYTFEPMQIYRDVRLRYGTFQVMLGHSALANTIVSMLLEVADKVILEDFVLPFTEDGVSTPSAKVDVPPTPEMVSCSDLAF